MILIYVDRWSYFVVVLFILIVIKGVRLLAFSAAMIPLAEFSDPVIMKKYKMKPDPETLDLLNTVARQKEVSI